MKLVLRLVETGSDGSNRSVDVLEIMSRNDPGDIAALGITLSQGKQLLGLIQQEFVAAQCRDHATRRPTCRSCATVCQVKDYRPRQIEPHRVYRRPHFLRDWGHHDEASITQIRP